MRRTTNPQIHAASTTQLPLSPARGFRRLAFFLFGLGSLLTSFAQTFVAEWNASANGGVGPIGMALSTENGVAYLYVSDQPRGRIVKFDTTTGAVAATFGQQGNANGEFNSPYGLALDPASGDLYVAERGNNRIQRVTKTGTFVMSWGSLGTANGQFMEPVGVAVDAAGDVYVVDHANNRVQKFHVTQTGGVWTAAHVMSWGSAGAGNGQFNLPYGIAADAAGNIYVADGFNGRVQRFNTSGVYQSTIGSAGPGPGQFIVATSVGIGAGGELLVTSTNSDPQNAALADVNNQWISRFSSAGAFVSRFGGTFGQAQGQFRLPFSAVAGPNNRVFVADYYNSRVQVFDLTAGGGGPDTTPPTVASFTTGTTTATSVTFQITFSEAVTGVDATDFTAVTTGGATATIGAVTGSGATYSIPVSFTGTGTVQLNLKATGTGIADTASNAIAVGATGPTFTIPTPGTPDTTPPTVASFTTGATTATSVTFQITFSEAVTGVDATDFTAVTTGGATATIGAVTGSGATYSIPVSFTGTGTVQLNLKATGTGIADTASNAIAVGATGPTFTIPTPGTPDTTPPTVASFTTGATTATSVTFQITFSEAVTGVDATDFTAVTTGGATATIGAVTGSGAAYSIPVSFTGTGTVQLNLKATGTGIADTASNAIAVGATGPTFTIPTPGTPDTTPPTVASFTTGATTATSVAFQITFSEAVTGVDATDFTAVTTGGATATIGAVTGSGATYSIPVSFTGTGTVQLNLKATGTGIADTASNAIAVGATGPTFTIPTGGGGTGGTQVISVTSPANGTYRKGQELIFVVRFNANVTVSGDDGKKSGGGDDDDDNEDDEDASAFITWTAVGSSGGKNLSGKATYRSGSGTSALTFIYKVKNGDLAPSGISLGTTIQLGKEGSIRDSARVALTTSRLTLPWAQNPLTGVIIDAPKSNNGNGNDNGNGNNNNQGNNGKGNDRLSNLSSRLRVTGGDANRTVVAGFVVNGTAPKPILIRAVGPGLAGFGIRDGVSQPRLTLRDSTGKLIAENDGWNNRVEISVAGDKVGAFKLAPGSRDAALLVALAPGAYTAQVTANGNGTALVEVYDASNGDQLITEQIVNISTRGFVDDGDDSIVAGFVITGNSPRQVLIRGVGPGLTALGVNGALADPVLKLHTSGTSAPIAQNDNWQTAQPINASQVVATAAEVTTATTAVGAFPLAAGSKDAALLITLAPGNYTAVMTGANGGTGAALIEVYEVR